jgi:hypothetical protein
MTEPIEWREVHWPTPLSSGHALEMLRRLATEPTRDPLIFEVEGDDGRVRYRVGAPRTTLDGVQHLINALIPGTALVPLTADRVLWHQALRLRLSDVALGLRADRAQESSRAILTALTAGERPDERLMLQITIGPGRPAHLTASHPTDPSQSLLSQLAFGQRRASNAVSRTMQDRAAEPGVLTVVRLAVTAQRAGRGERLLRGLVAALRTSQAAGTLFGFAPVDPERLSSLPRRGFARLTGNEVLAIAGWPLGDAPLPGLPSPHPKQLRLRRGADRTRVFAHTTAPGQDEPLGISIDDSLFHTVLTGPTGAGKSTILRRLIAADVAAGRAIVVIDPKTNLVRDALSAISPARHDDVVVLDPAQEQPIGLNPLAQPGRSPELIADSLLTVFKDLFPNMFGPRTSDVLHSALLTIAPIPRATLTWLPRLLTEAGFRRSLLADVTDESLLSFWQQFDAMSAAQQAQFIGPVLSRLRQFLLRPSLRRVLDQAEPAFHLRDLFTGKQRPLLFVPLNSGVLGGEAARLVGSLLVSQLFGLTLARASQPADKRHPVSIYIDEAPSFLRLGGELPEALAISRSLGVAYHVAHQYMGQWTPEVRDALDANARNKILFTLGVKDARDVAATSADLAAEDLLALPRFHIYANLMRDGQSTGWVSGRTLPPPLATSDPVALIAHSQRRYAQRPPDVLSSRPTEPTDELFGRKRRQR